MDEQIRKAFHEILSKMNLEVRVSVVDTNTGETAYEFTALHGVMVGDNVTVIHKIGEIETSNLSKR